MKTAISLPDELFAAAERMARRAGRRRSELYAAALREYLARHEPDAVTEALDRVVEDVGETASDVRFAAAAARRALSDAEW